jgi:hypothetical protein
LPVCGPHRLYSPDADNLRKMQEAMGIAYAKKKKVHPTNARLRVVQG